MTKIIDGKKIAEKIKDNIFKEIFEMNGARPNLAIILVGEREDSQMYVRMKEREASRVGVDTHLYKFDDDVSEDDLISAINFLNNDELIDGILVQLPLSDKFDTDKIISCIDPKKDVDCFHPENIKRLMNDFENCQLFSPVVNGILAMFSDIEFDLENKDCCILCNSDIFGNVLASVLNFQRAKAKVVHLSDIDWQEKIKKADVLISAIGKAKFIKKKMLKKDVVLIDVGTTKVDGKIFGDVDFDNLNNYASYISPVPGGVGPLTIAMLFKNVLELYRAK